MALPVPVRYDRDGVPWWTHAPDATLGYGRDWADWLGGDHIANAEWSADDGVLVLTSGLDGPRTWALLAVAPGTQGRDLTATVHVTSGDGRRDSRSVRLKVRAR
ncbi:MAG: hypothetical protein JNM98_06035 [Rhodocyclaceae bacterium]|nr:hypothetical protein [Rhodocyclaceae bacterium]